MTSHQLAEMFSVQFRDITDPPGYIDLDGELYLYRIDALPRAGCLWRLPPSKRQVRILHVSHCVGVVRDPSEPDVIVLYERIADHSFVSRML